MGEDAAPDLELTASEKFAEQLAEDVPELALYDRQQLKVSLAAVRQGLAQETVIWHIATKIGGIPNTHPNQVAKTCLSFMEQEKLLVSLLEGELPLPRPIDKDADGAGDIDVIQKKVIVPGADGA